MQGGIPRALAHFPQLETLLMNNAGLRCVTQDIHPAREPQLQPNRSLNPGCLHHVDVIDTISISVNAWILTSRCVVQWAAVGRDQRLRRPAVVQHLQQPLHGTAPVHIRHLRSVHAGPLESPNGPLP